jgi:hypothetical protein
MQWRQLNKVMQNLTEAQVLELLEQERKNLRRVAMLERLHQRYNTLRSTRERMEILKEAVK